MSQARAYLHMILTGEKTINDVPRSIRSEVVNLLIEYGHSDLTTSDENGVVDNHC